MGVGQAFPAQLYRRAPGAVPTATYFSGGTGSSQGLISGTITLPAGIVTGDIGIITATWAVGQVSPQPTTLLTAPVTPSGTWPLIVYRPDIPIPKGLTAQPTGQGPNVCTYVWMQPLTSADSSAVVTITMPSGSTSQPLPLAGVIVHGSNGQPGLAVSTTNYGYNNGLTYIDGYVEFPSAFPGPQDYVILGGGACFIASTGATTPNGGTLSAAPTGCTIQVNSQANMFNGFVSFLPANGAWLLSVPSSSFQGQVLTTTTVTNSTPNPGTTKTYVAGTFAMWFTPKGYKSTDKLPSDIVSSGTSLYSQGHSYGCYVAGVAGTLVPNLGHYAQALYFRRMQHSIGAASGYLTQEMGPNNANISGSMVLQQVAGAYGTVVQTTQVAGTADAYAVNTAQTWVPLTSNQSSTVIFIDGNFNDLKIDCQLNGASAPTQLYQNGALNSTDALVRLLRCSAIHPPTFNSSFSGSWPTASSTSYNSGTAYYTTSPGNTVTITTTSQNIDLILLGLDDTQNIGSGNPGQTGAAYTWTASNGGTQFASGSGTTNNQMAWCNNPGLNGTGGTGNYSQNYFGQMCVPIYNMPAGTNTIVLTHNGSNGQYLYYNGWLDQSQTITPWVVLCKTPRNLTYTGPAGGNPTGSIQQGNTVAPNHSSPFNIPGIPFLTQTIVDLFNTQYDTIAARFSDGRVLVYDPVASYNDIAFNNATMINTDDQLHMVEPGEAHRFHCLTRFMNARMP